MIDPGKFNYTTGLWFYKLKEYAQAHPFFVEADRLGEHRNSGAYALLCNPAASRYNHQPHVYIDHFKLSMSDKPEIAKKYLLGDIIPEPIHSENDLNKDFRKR